jgi:hypothetical protein
MEDWKPLIDQLYREEVERARRQTPAERFQGVLEMTKASIALMRAGVRDQYPEADERELVQRGRERLARIRRVTDRGIFADPGR